jgi:(p)ppGpp synthase/HD superfamily hydrolase
MENQNQMLSKAIALAANKHVGQHDKGGYPYIMHVIQVMTNTSKYTDDFEVLQIAALHDVVEDTKTTFAELKAAGFSDRVIAGVRALTKLPGQTNEEYMEIISQNIDAVIVKLSDIEHNSLITRMKGISPKDFERILKYQTMYHTLKNTYNQLLKG